MSRCRETSTRRRCSHPSRRSARAPPPSSTRRRVAPGTSSTWATASCPRPRSITCARWSTPSTSCRRGNMPADGVLLLAFGGPTRAPVALGRRVAHAPPLRDRGCRRGDRGAGDATRTAPRRGAARLHRAQRAGRDGGARAVRGGGHGVGARRRRAARPDPLAGRLPEPQREPARALARARRERRAPRARRRRRARRRGRAGRLRLRSRRGALRPRRRGARHGGLVRPRLRARQHRERPSPLHPDAGRGGRGCRRMSARVAVVGGGVAGLAAGHRLGERGVREVVLLEAGDRLGGSIATERSGGFTIEAGADALLTEKPWAVDLCERLGVSLVGTREGERRTYVVHDGRLEPLPEGFLLLAPTNLRALAASPLFPWRGKLRMALDLVLPGDADAADESLAHFVRRRFGREALERVAEPLAGGIYTADAERLSLAATMPRFRELERKYRSVIRGLRASAGASRAAGARYSLFAAPADGMGALVEALARRLPEGVVRLRSPVGALARDGATWRLRAAGAALAVDALVLAAPAHAVAPLLAALAAELGRLLGGIDYASS